MNNNTDEIRITIPNAKGDPVEYEVILTFTYQVNNIEYVVYTDNSVNENGEVNVYASRLKRDDNGNAVLEGIIDDDEWFVVETVLDKLQNTTESNDTNPSDLCHKNRKRIDQSEISIISNSGIGKEDYNSNALNKERLVSDRCCSDVFFDDLVIERDSLKIEEMFRLIEEKGIHDPEYFYSLGGSSYEAENYLVAEKAYRLSIQYSDDKTPTLIGCKNNLAYMIRKKEVKDFNERSMNEVPRLLRDGVIRGDTFSLINMALFWICVNGKEDDWDLADELVSHIDKNDVYNASIWWQELYKDRKDAEGCLVHLFLLCHKKLDSSSLGDIDSLFRIVKGVYATIPDRFGRFV